MSMLRGKKLCMLSLQKKERSVDIIGETNNPDSILFIENQFPKPYDGLLNDKITEYEELISIPSHSSYNKNAIECIQQQNKDSVPIIIINSQNFEPSIKECHTLKDVTVSEYFEIVDNVIIEESIEQIPQSSPQHNFSPVLTNEPSTVIENIENNTCIHIEASDTNLYNNNIYLHDDSALTLPFEEPASSTEVAYLNPLTTKLVDYSDSESEHDEPKVKRKKRCQVKKEEWASQTNKKNREKGKEYYGKKKIDGNWNKNIKKSQKVLKPRCRCRSTKTSVIKCNDISDDDRKLLFDQFWSMTWDEKRVYIQNIVNVIHTNRQRDRKDPEKSKRTNTLIYFLKKGEDMVRVCKTLKQTCVWSWKIRNKTNTDETNEQILKNGKKPFDKEVKALQEFLDKIPKMPSHYCRKRTEQLYLQPDIASIRQLYELYVDHCKSQSINPLSIATFSNTLTIRKISVFKPKKDLCETCNGYKMGHISDAIYKDHIDKKNEARQEKEIDKEKKEFVFTADLQAVLLAPRSNVSSNYYKTKLCVHNWCIYDMKTSDGYCFIWNESEGGLNSDEFSTIITSFFIETVIPKMGDSNRNIILYTDGCTYQNRNVTLSNALLNVAMLHNVTIEQKYLEVGHTQMEVDSMHAMIEKKLKNQIINVPAEYITICKKAKTNKAYNVQYLTYTYFKNLKELEFYRSIRPGKMKGDPKVTDIRALKYVPSGEILYKLRFSEAYLLNQRRTMKNQAILFKNISNLYNERKKITKKKFLDLQQLKNSMPQDYQNYYDNLPHEDLKSANHVKVYHKTY